MDKEIQTARQILDNHSQKLSLEIAQKSTGKERSMKKTSFGQIIIITFVILVLIIV